MTLARQATVARSGTVLPNHAAMSALRPIDPARVSLGPGFWAERLRINRERTIPHGYAELRRVGTLRNFELAAGVRGPYQAIGIMFNEPFPFLDSDVYKWLEAVGWELGRVPDDELTRSADEAIDLVVRAQRPDGYINSFVQVLAPDRVYRDLQWGHELYCFGHLIQAAIAWHRAVGDDRLLEVAVRAADSIDRELGAASGREGIDGHPLIEMALVELFRTTGEERYLALAARMIDLRGHGMLGEGRYGAAYWQDHAPVREAKGVAGHAVRQLYLDCGAVDVATELGDRGLLDAVHARWRDMIATRMYLTGGLGSRYQGEAFGDPFELPPDLAYTETCAAIANVMLARRLLLATGDPDCADLIERTMYNGVLPGVSLDGTAFFYVNPLQRRTGRVAAAPGSGERQRWFPCACCPPNLMRTFASWPEHLATVDDTGVQVQQYATAEITAQTAGGPVRLGLSTDYPWSGEVAVTVLDAPAEPWTLSLRIPGWCRSARLRSDAGSDDRPIPAAERAVRETRTWRTGDALVLAMDLPARVTEPDHRVDAVRGCVALERGPLVYCVETADVAAGLDLEEIELGHAPDPIAVPRADLGTGTIGLEVTASRHGRPETVDVGAVPYFARANRTVDAMRVWIPRRRSGDD